MPQPLDYWRLCTDFTVVQAALIICGHSPEDLQWAVERRPESNCPAGYVAVRTALRNGLASGRLQASDLRFEIDDSGETGRYIDLHNTTISAQEVDRFLKASGMVCDFFDRSDLPHALPALDARQMPKKLAAAVKAWAAVSSDPSRLRGKSPKQALEAWLLEQASELGLLNRKGEANRTGIEEICKVANWKPEGGATPTPSVTVENRPTPLRLPGLSTPAADPPPWADDEEIPF